MRNRRLRSNRKRARNEVMNLRQQMDTNPNYNIFVGDKRYQTDFWLQFHEKQSLFKYK